MALDSDQAIVTAVWLHGMGSRFFEFCQEQQQLLAAALPMLDIRLCDNEEAFAEALADATLAISWFFKKEWFDLAPDLRWLITPAAGKDYSDILPPGNIHQYNGGFHGKLMGETALGMMLAASRGILDTMRLQDHDPWPRQPLEARLRLFRGSHLVIWGFGNIGQWVGRLAKPFGVRITGIRRTPQAPSPDYFTAADQMIGNDQIDDILPTADHLILILPATKDTNHVIDASRLAALPPHAWLYNLGRGNAIDEAALVEALHSGQIAGACLDVFQQEPLPEDSPLRQAPNVLLMPHASAMAPQYLRYFIEELAERYPREIAPTL